MDFFARQDRARRRTVLLVAYFVLAIVCIVVFSSICFLPLGAAVIVYLVWWDWPILPLQGDANVTLRLALFYSAIVAALPTLAVILFGSLYKIAALAAGGRAVARSLGGRLLTPGPSDARERKLLNVVEEMAIASGLPMPRVYVLDSESAINAFVAGYAPADAAVCVTRGCVQWLDREELQGVIGHEFSHILNGDMRLNTRLIGIIFGFTCLMTGGRSLGAAGLKAEKGWPLAFLGLLFMLFGAIGYFFGRLIQAAVSRQREFLADASAVQFTRNPLGLSGALQKIAALDSRFESPRATDACHMFFGNGLGDPWIRFLATHPPIEERIRAIDPSWNGTIKEVHVPDEPKPIDEGPRPSDGTPMLPTVVRANEIVPSVGQPTSLHLRYAQQFRQALPDELLAATRDPRAAQALVYALLLSADDAPCARQLQEIGQQVGQAVREKAVALHAEITRLAVRGRLPLVDLLLPTLRLLRPDEFQRFRDLVKWLVVSDEHIDLFEFMLLRVIQRNLAPQFSTARPRLAQYYSVNALVPDAAVLLSALAGASSADDREVAKAFHAGAPYLGAGDVDITLLPRDRAGLDRVSAALDRLAQAVPRIKKRTLDACVHVVGADGVVQEREAELLRAISVTLDCPIPPFVDIE